MSQTEVNGAAELKQLIEYIAKSLVEKPEAVMVEETVVADTVEFALQVAEDDMGKVIGKQGRIAKAIRSVLRAASIRSGVKCTLKIG